MSIQDIIAEDSLRLQCFACATLESPDSSGSTSANSYDAAFLSYISPEIQQQAKVFRQCQALPFDPESRRRRMVIEDTTTHTCYLIVIGAVETLLDLSDCQEERRNWYRAEVRRYGTQGIRALGLACRQLPETGEPIDIQDHEQHLTFLGFVTLVDPLRSTTKQTIAQTKSLGVAIKILSGDSREVATYIGSQIGLGDTAYTGDELARMSPEALRHAVSTCNIFARVSPTQKYTLIMILKERYVVGYQGDGINDAPALKLADVGLAVNTATAVARECADIVLLAQDLSVITNGIQHGRAIFLNIEKYLKYTMVGNFGNFFALAILYLLSLNLPLLPVQLLLTSLLTDIPLVTIASDTVNEEEMLAPEKYDTHALMFLSLLLGSFTALFEVFFFTFVQIYSPHLVQTSLFLFLTGLQLIVIVVIRNRTSFWRGKRASWQLILAMTLTLVISLALPYLNVFESLFHFTPLPVWELAIIVALLMVYVMLLDVIKTWYYRLIGRATRP